MFKRFILFAFIAFALISCEDETGVQPNEHDISIALPDEFSVLIYRDIINHNYKLSMNTVESYSLEYTYKINSVNTVNSDNSFISMELKELQGYKNPNFDGSSVRQADLFLNLGLLNKDKYDLTVTHPQLGEYSAVINIFDDFMSIESETDDIFVNLQHDTVRFIPDNVFWGTVTYTETSNFDPEQYMLDILNNGANVTVIEPGFYSYFSVKNDGEIQPKTFENSEGINLNYYFEYTDLDKVKEVINSYSSDIVKVINFTADGEVFPEIE